MRCSPSGSGDISETVDVPVGGTVTYTVDADVLASATGNLSNTATVAVPGGVTDPDGGNNTATDTDAIDARADLTITKDDGTATYIPGGSLTYTIVVSNAGPSDVTGATVADTFSALLTNVTWTCAAAGGAACVYCRGESPAEAGRPRPRAGGNAPGQPSTAYRYSFHRYERP